MTEPPLFFSIIIPTYRRPELLKACLRSLARQDYPADRFEVIVVDDGGELRLESVVDPFRDRLDVTLLAQSHAGPAAARNTGATRAKGHFLAFVDDDCAPAPDWLQALAVRFPAALDHAIGGRTLNGLPDNPYASASQLLIDYLYAYYNADRGHARFFAANNLAFPVNQFQAVGGLDTAFSRAGAEDREFCDRWLSRGYRMTYAPEVQVYHTHPLTLRTFWRQHFTYGRGAFLFHRVRAQRNRQRIRVEPLSFYMNLFRYPFGTASGRHALRLAALMALSQVAHTIGFLWESAVPLRRP